MSHKQYEGWRRWLEKQWNEPSRSDWYQMQVAACLKGLGGVSERIEDQKIPFVLSSGEDGEGEPPQEWDSPEGEGDIESQRENRGIPAPARPEDRITLSPRITAAGGMVRVTQPDGSLRMYNVMTQKYVDEV